jgi:hypothetical protein
MEVVLHLHVKEAIVKLIVEKQEEIENIQEKIARTIK